MAWSLSFTQSMDTQEYKRNLLDIYLDEILKTIKPSDIIPYLITLKEFDYGEFIFIIIIIIYFKNVNLSTLS